jgi:hypothetical protein
VLGGWVSLSSLLTANPCQPISQEAGNSPAAASYPSYPLFFITLLERLEG